MSDMEKEARAEILGSRIALLFTMVSDLIEFRDLLEEVVSSSSSRASMAASMAPIFGAMGEDYEQVQMENRLYADRASSILNLINTLERSEQTRQEYIVSKAAKDKGREQLRQMFGGKL